MFEALVLSSTHAECIKSVVHILSSVNVPVLQYYILLKTATLFKLLVTSKKFVQTFTHLFTNKLNLGMTEVSVQLLGGLFIESD